MRAMEHPPPALPGRCDRAMASRKIAGIAAMGRSYARGQVGGQVFRDIAGIIRGTRDETRIAPPEERQAQHVKSGRLADDAAVVLQLSLAVEHRHVQETEVRLESRGPDDRANGIGPCPRLNP